MIIDWIIMSWNKVNSIDLVFLKYRVRRFRVYYQDSIYSISPFWIKNEKY